MSQIGPISPVTPDTLQSISTTSANLNARAERAQRDRLAQMQMAQQEAARVQQQQQFDADLAQRADLAGQEMGFRREQLQAETDIQEATLAQNQDIAERQIALREREAAQEIEEADKQRQFLATQEANRQSEARRQLLFSFEAKTILAEVASQEAYQRQIAEQEAVAAEQEAASTAAGVALYAQQLGESFEKLVTDTRSSIEAERDAAVSLGSETSALVSEAVVGAAGELGQAQAVAEGSAIPGREGRGWLNDALTFIAATAPGIQAMNVPGAPLDTLGRVTDRAEPGLIRTVGNILTTRTTDVAGPIATSVNRALGGIPEVDSARLNEALKPISTKIMADTVASILPTALSPGADRGAAEGILRQMVTVVVGLDTPEAAEAAKPQVDQMVRQLEDLGLSRVELGTVMKSIADTMQSMASRGALMTEADRLAEGGAVTSDESLRRMYGALATQLRGYEQRLAGLTGAKTVAHYDAQLRALDRVAESTSTARTSGDILTALASEGLDRRFVPETSLRRIRRAESLRGDAEQSNTRAVQRLREAQRRQTEAGRPNPRTAQQLRQLRDDFFTSPEENIR